MAAPALYRASNITHRGDTIKEITYIMSIEVQNVLLGLLRSIYCRNLFLRFKSQKKCRFLSLKFIKHSSYLYMCNIHAYLFLFKKLFPLQIFITALMLKLLCQQQGRLGEMIQTKIYHLWILYLSEKEKKMESNNYSTKFSEKGKREMHKRTPNIGYCI